VVLTRKWTPELTGWIETRLEGKFGLEINREKTRVVEVKADGGTRQICSQWAKPRALEF